MDLIHVARYRRAVRREDLTLAPGEAYVAGGSWLFSQPQPGVTGLVDLTTLGWPPVEELPDGGVRVAATCTIEQLQRHAWPTPVAGLVRGCADALLMSFKVQRAATVGGNICLALPAGAMIALTAAMDGEAVVWTTDDERREPVASLVAGAGVTSLQPGEVLRAVDLPAAALAARYAWRRIALTEYGRTAALVIARRDGDRITLTVTGSTPRPERLVFSADVGLKDIFDGIADIEEWYEDAHGAADWRSAMTLRLAIEAAAEVLT